MLFLLDEANASMVRYLIAPHNYRGRGHLSAVNTVLSCLAYLAAVPGPEQNAIPLPLAAAIGLNAGDEVTWELLILPVDDAFVDDDILASEARL